MSCERKRSVVNLVPGRGAAGTNEEQCQQSETIGYARVRGQARLC